MKKFLKRINAKQKGFTLIELLVVIAIIGILAAIIVPNVSKYIGGGTDAAAQSELKIVTNAVAASMAGAKTGVLTAANSAPDPDATPVTSASTVNFGPTKDFVITTTSGTVAVSSYMTGGIAKVKGTYAIGTDGSVAQVTTGY